VPPEKMGSPPAQQRVLEAAAAGDEAGLRCLLAAGGLAYGAKAADRRGWGPLHHAAAKGRAGCCCVLLEAGAPLAEKDKDNQTGLHKAARHAEATEVLAAAAGKPDLAAKDQRGATPLVMAAAAGCVGAIVALLMAAQRLGCRPAAANATDRRGAGLLMLAAGGGHAAAVAMLLDEPTVMVDATDGNGNSALMAAARSGSAEAVQFLLAAGADIGVRSKNGNSALSEAANAGYAAVLQQLLAAAVQPPSVRDLATAVHAACTKDDQACLEALVIGVAPELQPKLLLSKLGGRKDTALHTAAAAGSTAAIRVLLAVGAGVKCAPDSILLSGKCLATPNGTGRPPLFVAVEMGHLEASDELLRAGAAVAPPRDDGLTALHLAAERGTPELLDLLLPHTATADLLVLHKGATALTLAARRGCADSVDLMLVDGWPVDGSLAAAVMAAAEFNHSGVMRQLLQVAGQGAGAAAMASFTDGDGWTTLHVAALHGAVDCVEALLDAAGGEIVDISNIVKAAEGGVTPLMRSCHHGQAACLQLLVNRGADPGAKDRRGRRALHHAAKGGATPNDCVALLVGPCGQSVEAADANGRTPLLAAPTSCGCCYDRRSAPPCWRPTSTATQRCTSPARWRPTNW
jgi:ankyrin repeat protein